MPIVRQYVRVDMKTLSGGRGARRTNTVKTYEPSIRTTETKNNNVYTKTEYTYTNNQTRKPVGGRAPSVRIARSSGSRRSGTRKG